MSSYVGRGRPSSASAWSHAETATKQACVVSGPLARDWSNGIPVIHRELTDTRTKRAAFVKVRGWVPACRVVVTMIRCVFVARARVKQSFTGRLGRWSKSFVRNGLTSISMVKQTGCNKPFCAKGAVPTNLRQHPFCSVLVVGLRIPGLQ